MKVIAEECVFHVGERSVLWIDILLYSVLFGDFREFEKQLRHGIVLQETLEEDEEVSSDAIQEALTEFRYERDLIAAEDAEKWLCMRHLSLDDLTDFLLRKLLREAHNDSKGLQEATRDLLREDLLSCIRAEGYCSGFFAEAARSMAQDMSICDISGYDTETSEAVMFGQNLCDEAKEFLAFYDLEGDFEMGLEQKLRFLSWIDKASRDFSSEEISSSELEEEISRHFIEWTRVEFRLACFSREGEAREVALCVRQDGSSLAELAAEYNFDLISNECFIEELTDSFGEGIASNVFSAAAGELVGPVPYGSETIVIEINEKVLPDAVDALLKNKARVHCVQRRIEQAVGSCVRWNSEPRSEGGPAS